MFITAILSCCVTFIAGLEAFIVSFSIFLCLDWQAIKTLKQTQSHNKLYFIIHILYKKSIL